jgi:hypothetical protein
MLKRVQVFCLTMAVLLIFTLLPGKLTPAAPPEPLNALNRADIIEAPLNCVSAPSSNEKESTIVPSTSSVIQTGAENVEFVGHIGGATNAVAVQGHYAYIGLGPRLTVFSNSRFDV